MKLKRKSPTASTDSTPYPTNGKAWRAMKYSRGIHWGVAACVFAAAGCTLPEVNVRPANAAAAENGASPSETRAESAAAGQGAPPAALPGSANPNKAEMPKAPAADGGMGISTKPSVNSGAAGSSSPQASAPTPSSGVNTAAAGSGAAATSSMLGQAIVRGAAPSEALIKKAGEYNVKSYTEADGLVGSDAYGAAATQGDGSELYYPEGATAPFAAMVIVAGFTAQRSDVAPWGQYLASHGIVSLVIDTNTTSDQPDVRARGLLDAVGSLKKENQRDGSPLKGKLDTTRVGLMGWQMGGGGVWINADSHPELKVAVSLCGWITASGIGSNTKVPSLHLAAKGDALAGGMSQPVYNSIPSATPKMLVEWSGGDHFVNNNPMNQDNDVGGYGLPWIKVFLEGDDRYRQFFKRMPPGTSDYMTNQ